MGKVENKSCYFNYIFVGKNFFAYLFGCNDSEADGRVRGDYWYLIYSMIRKASEIDSPYCHQEQTGIWIR